MMLEHFRSEAGVYFTHARLSSCLHKLDILWTLYRAEEVEQVRARPLQSINVARLFCRLLSPLFIAAVTSISGNYQPRTSMVATCRINLGHIVSSPNLFHRPNRTVALEPMEKSSGSCRSYFKSCYSGGVFNNQCFFCSACRSRDFCVRIILQRYDSRNRKNKYVTDTVGVYLQQVVWSFGIVLTLVFYAFLKSNLPTLRTEITRREVMLGVLAGLLYLGASFFMLQSYKYIDASVGFTIIQLNALWTIAIGVYIFKEVDLKLHRNKVWWGIAFAILGIALLLFTRK